jgi:hypothetical protein
MLQFIGLLELLGELGCLGPSEIGFAFHPVHIHYRAGGINLLSLLRALLYPVRKPRCLPRAKLSFYRGLQQG